MKTAKYLYDNPGEINSFEDFKLVAYLFVEDGYQSLLREGDDFSYLDLDNFTICGIRQCVIGQRARHLESEFVMQCDSLSINFGTYDMTTRGFLAPLTVGANEHSKCIDYLDDLWRKRIERHRSEEMDRFEAEVMEVALCMAD